MDNDELVAALDAHDESLLRHVDAEGQLSCAAASMVGRTARDLLDGRLQWTAVADTEWHALVSAFVITYGTEALDDARLRASLGQDVLQLSSSDRQFLTQLVTVVDLYLDARTGTSRSSPGEDTVQGCTQVVVDDVQVDRGGADTGVT
jgi:hypothetical protein